MNNILPFRVDDLTEIVEVIYKNNRALAHHTWQLLQKCRETCLNFREFMKTVTDIPGKYMSRRIHLSNLKGRVCGLLDGLVIAGIITPVQSDLLSDFAYALN